jgi:choline dehydrogenase
MINLRSFEVPTVVKHAPGAITLLADQIKALGCKRPMLVTDKGLMDAGLVNEATHQVGG